MSSAGPGSIVVLLLLLASCSEQTDRSAASPRVSGGDDVVAGRTLVIGSVSSRTLDEDKLFRPFVDYLAAKLSAHDIVAGDVVITGSSQQMAERFRSGAVDLYVDSPLTAVRVGRDAPARPLLRRWKNGVAEYRSVIFARRSAGLDSIDDLTGHTIAFESEFSTSGCLLPKTLLIRAGKQIVEVGAAGSGGMVGSDEIGYCFSRDDENTIFWVLNDRVVAGAMSRMSYEELAGSRIDELRVVAESAPVPRHVLMVRDNLDRQLVHAIEQVLLAMDEDPRGAEVLLAFEQTTRFDRFPDGVESALRQIRQLDQLLEGESR